MPVPVLVRKFQPEQQCIAKGRYLVLEPVVCVAGRSGAAMR